MSVSPTIGKQWEFRSLAHLLLHRNRSIPQEGVRLSPIQIAPQKPIRVTQKKENGRILSMKYWLFK